MRRNPASKPYMDFRFSPRKSCVSRSVGCHRRGDERSARQLLMAKLPTALILAPSLQHSQSCSVHLPEQRGVFTKACQQGKSRRRPLRPLRTHRLLRPFFCSVPSELWHPSTQQQQQQQQQQRKVANALTMRVRALDLCRSSRRPAGFLFLIL
jgi:hypothetical protein